MSKRVLITGSSGLVGSEAVAFYDRLGWDVHGIDNNARADFFGAEASTIPNLRRLQASTSNFTHHQLNITHRYSVESLMKNVRPDLIIHAAAQPSHDLAASRPFDDFDVNAGGTLNLLEAARACDPVFVFISTNKVYGDAPNEIPVTELATRFDYTSAIGVDETMRVDQSMHSIFGASKLAADVMTQEYGRYFGMRTTVLRCGCITGANHAGVKLHGFLSHLFKSAAAGEPYTIIGHNGKQVRDNIHAHDLIGAIDCIRQDPKSGAVYNMGGGRANSCSVMEAVAVADELIGMTRVDYEPTARKGDHVCYISDTSKFQRDYPEWRLSRSLEDIYRELAGDLVEVA